jgi:rubrerythrin
MKLCTTLLIGTLTVCLCAAGQDTQGKLPESEIALLRAAIQTKKTDILQQNLMLSEEQAKTFWPLQRSYDNDLSTLGDQRLEVIREYARNWDNLTDETAKDLGKRLLDYQKRRVELRSRYFHRMSKAISPTIAAKFFQVETQLENIVDLEIASSVPLIK